MAANLQDTEIIAMLASDRERGFRLLMRSYGKALYWHIRRIVVDHDDAEDALQEASIKIFRSIDSFRGEGKLSSWIYRIATNEAIGILRKRKGFFQSLDSLGPKLESALEHQANLPPDQMEVLFQKALLKLPTQQRIVFNMRYYDELSYEEIAEATGKNVGALKANYQKKKKKVKNYLKENI